MQDQLHDVGVAAAVSVTAAGASHWFADTLPVVQWCAGIVAIVSGLLAIALGLLKLRHWFQQRRTT